MRRIFFTLSVFVSALAVCVLKVFVPTSAVCVPNASVPVSVVDTRDVLVVISLRFDRSVLIPISVKALFSPESCKSVCVSLISDAFFKEPRDAISASSRPIWRSVFTDVSVVVLLTPLAVRSIVLLASLAHCVASYISRFWPACRLRRSAFSRRVNRFSSR
jgi:hypothetical protein